MKTFFTLFLIAISIQIAPCQISIKAQNAVTNPLEDSLVRTLAGFGIAVSNISSNLSPDAVANGTFKAGAQFPIRRGLIMTTGLASDMRGANSGPVVSGQIPYTDTIDGTSLGRQLLRQVLTSNGTIPSPTDVSTIKLDLIPIGDSLKFNYIFASEEYNTFVCSNFNDVFGFFIKGEGIVGDPMFDGSIMEGFRNIAIIPDTDLPVSINTVNNGTAGTSGQAANCTFTQQGIASYVENLQPDAPYYNFLKFNGMSTRLTAKAPTIACTPYTLILAVADVSDRSYDSGVFIEAGSIVSGDYSTFFPFANNGMNDTITSCQPGRLKFKRCPLQVADKWVIRFENQGTAVANVDFKRRMPNGDLVEVPDSIVLYPDMAEDSILLEPLGTTNLNKKIVYRYFDIQHPFVNGQPNLIPGNTTLVLKPNVNLAGLDLTRCWFDTGTFQSQFLNLPNTTYQWFELVNGNMISSNNLSCSDCNNPVIFMDSLDRKFIIKTTLNNSDCIRFDTVNVIGLKFLPPTFSTTTNQITITNPQQGYTYSWSINGQIIPGNLVTISFSPGDSIQLRATGTNGCEGIYNKNQIFTSIIEQKEGLERTLVFPNPAADLVTIITSSPQSQVEIFDILGRTKIRKTINGSENINLKSLEPGTYILSIRNRSGLVRKEKLIISR